MSNDIKMIIHKDVIENQIDGVFAATKTEFVLPLIMTSSSMNYKTVLNDELIQYAFNFELAHDLKQYI